MKVHCGFSACARSPSARGELVETSQLPHHSWGFFVPRASCLQPRVRHRWVGSGLRLSGGRRRSRGGKMGQEAWLVLLCSPPLMYLYTRFYSCMMCSRVRCWSCSIRLLPGGAVLSRAALRDAARGGSGCTARAHRHRDRVSSGCSGRTRCPGPPCPQQSWR